ncbi:hypothetical protein SAY87_012847 [Trapa incisa]|uniref:Peptidase metallopeptidase domain-containing protein n=1 Tax=Trapa incisa TaxID=236973 RepID=A0AAN7GR59_9MYRT|nr:hypothetical protein SAY87_012847 [Trapa incisa]
MRALFFFFFFLWFFCSVLFIRPCVHARILAEYSLAAVQPATVEYDDVSNATWQDFTRFLDAGVGAHVVGMSELKRYFSRFGYLSPLPAAENLTDVFDGNFESAVVRYQNKLGIPVTGKLDAGTISAIMAPRCGVSDEDGHGGGGGYHSLMATRHYAYFYGRPRWGRGSPSTLTYAFSPNNMVSYLDPGDVRATFRRAFSRWSAVIPVSFEEVEYNGAADIRIAFYRGAHGDGEPFDGVLGVLAHAFSPENGMFHLDAAERWSVDFRKEKSKAAVDLESVATHEIGHILGLSHSSVKEAVMYPSLSPRTTKAELRIDDVEGVQALYGSNPNFKLSSLLESENSSNHGGAGLGGIRRFSAAAMWTAAVVLALLSCP